MSRIQERSLGLEIDSVRGALAAVVGRIRCARGAPETRKLHCRYFGEANPQDGKVKLDLHRGQR